MKGRKSSPLRTDQAEASRLESRPGLPHGGQCKVESLEYRARVTEANGNTEPYTGTFKKRYYGHDPDFNHMESKGTTLSTHVWKLKDEN